MSVKYDYQRLERLGMPEAILCDGKHAEHLEQLLEELLARPEHPALFTRLHQQVFDTLAPHVATPLDYCRVSNTAILHGVLPQRTGSVAVVTAGTSDLRVAMEASRTLEFTGIPHTLIADVGVAGVWRLLERIDEIRSHDVVIVVAGMDAALASVLGGLVDKCIIGVPTSIGYGVAAGGNTALNAMLASCGQGVTVTNIDNGFGAACAAIRILNAINSQVTT